MYSGVLTSVKSGWFYLPLYFSVCLKYFMANHSWAKGNGRKLISSSALSYSGSFA